MRRLGALAILLALINGDQAVAGPVSSLQPADVARIAAAGFGELSIVDAGVRELAWAAWDTGIGGDRSVHLALLDRNFKPVRVAWSWDSVESYAPRLSTLTQWRFDGAPVLALTFQQGAAAQSVVLFGIDASGHSVMLARRDAAAIELRSVGHGVIVLLNGPGSEPARECLVWNASAHNVAAQICDAVAR